jgi:PBP1b-binding outer membrane lipoprotein LpoB
MEENLELGEVSVIYDDYLSKSVKETKIQLTRDIAVIFKINKTTNDVDMTIKNTLIDDLEYGGKLDKNSLEKMLKAQKDMFRQLT